MNCPNEKCEGKILAVGTGEVPSVMEYLSSHYCYVCPWCKTEVWVKDNSQEITSESIRKLLREELAQQNLVRKKGSSRKAGRKAKNRIVKYQSWWQRD